MMSAPPVTALAVCPPPQSDEDGDVVGVLYADSLDNEGGLPKEVPSPPQERMPL